MGLLTYKKRLPYNLYCVGGDVKHCTIQYNPINLDLKVGREVDVTSAGRLFHIRAATTGNDQSPTVASRVGGTAKAEVDDDRRRCRPGIPATGCRVSVK